MNAQKLEAELILERNRVHRIVAGYTTWGADWYRVLNIYCENRIISFIPGDYSLSYNTLGTSERDFAAATSIIWAARIACGEEEFDAKWLHTDTGNPVVIITLS